ncbi:MAG TPA: response regulator transcription factor [Candidatus Udaeobacter sp.]|jgi:DNA-binding NarL/FixJ family response regulator
MKKKNNKGNAKIRVMVVDDHAGMREALRLIVNSEPDLAVVAEAESGRSAIELLQHTKADVVLMDGSMPEMNGIEATRQLTELQPRVKIIGLTLYQEATYLEEMIAAGARGYVSKTGDPTNVARAIRIVAADETYLDQSVFRHSSPTPQDRPVTGELTAVEIDVLKRLANGRTNAEIAADMNLTPSAVQTHRTTGMKKLNLRSRAELTRVAAARQWLDT